MEYSSSFVGIQSHSGVVVVVMLCCLAQFKGYIQALSAIVSERS